MDAFGVAKNADAADFGFATRQFDSDIGLYYFNGNWYDPDTGIFIQQSLLPDIPRGADALFVPGSREREDPNGVWGSDMAPIGGRTPGTPSGPGGGQTGPGGGGDDGEGRGGPGSPGGRWGLPGSYGTQKESAPAGPVASMDDLMNNPSARSSQRHRRSKSAGERLPKGRGCLEPVVFGFAIGGFSWLVGPLIMLA